VKRDLQLEAFSASSPRCINTGQAAQLSDPGGALGELGGDA